LFDPLVSLLIGFGSVLTVDWYGLLFLLRGLTAASQSFWWPALVIGFLTHQARH
jgi:hypothetical protein